MYLPSAGFCCLAAALLTPSSPALGRQVAISLLGLVGSAMAYAARARNLDWMSSDRIFESGIRFEQSGLIVYNADERALLKGLP